MIGGAQQLGTQRALAMFADWTDRIAAGEVPPAPPRPQGVERNVVITQWDWADPKAYLHDEVSTDRRNPTVNANGLIYGALELSADYSAGARSGHATPSSQVHADGARSEHAARRRRRCRSRRRTGASEAIWTSKNNVHNPMIDEKGRVWITSAVRPPRQPGVLQGGLDHPSAKLFPLEQARPAARGRTIRRRKKLTHISTCFGTHHLMFAEDANNTLWTSGGGQVVGWLNTKMFDETGDEEKSQGWTALILDTNGNGKRDAYVEPDQPRRSDEGQADRVARSTRVAPAPDGSVWGSVARLPGRGRSG